MSSPKLVRKLITVPADGVFEEIRIEGCGVIVAQSPVFELYSHYPKFHFTSKNELALEIYPESKYGQPFDRLYIEGTTLSEGASLLLFISQVPIDTDINPVVANLRDAAREFEPGTSFNESIDNATVFSFSDAQKFKGGTAGTGKAASVLISPENESLRFAFGTDPNNATPLGHLLGPTDPPLVIDGYENINDFRALSNSATASDVTFTVEFPKYIT